MQHIHKEAWGFECLDEWETWYDQFVTESERKELNKLRRRAQRLRKPSTIQEAYFDGFELLHNPLLRSLGVSDIQKADIDFTHLGEEGEYDEEGFWTGDLGYTIITWSD